MPESVQITIVICVTLLLVTIFNRLTKKGGN